MNATEFLKMRNIVAKDKTDLIIGFDNGTKESLIELLDSYHEMKLKKLRVADVSGAVCLHESQYRTFNYESNIERCDKCGEITN